MENPNILVLTDRIDLDDQISKTFVACGLPNPKQASSVAELRDAVARAGNGQILLSTIFKFADSKTAIPNSDNWIVRGSGRSQGQAICRLGALAHRTGQGDRQPEA